MLFLTTLNPKLQDFLLLKRVYIKDRRSKGNFLRKKAKNDHQLILKMYFGPKVLSYIHSEEGRPSNYFFILIHMVKQIKKKISTVN